MWEKLRMLVYRSVSNISSCLVDKKSKVVKWQEIWDKQILPIWDHRFGILLACWSLISRCSWLRSPTIVTHHQQRTPSSLIHRNQHHEIHKLNHTIAPLSPGVQKEIIQSTILRFACDREANSNNMRVNSGTHVPNNMTKATEIIYLSLFLKRKIPRSYCVTLGPSPSPPPESLTVRCCWNPSTWRQTRQQHSMTHQPWKEPSPWGPPWEQLHVNKQKQQRQPWQPFVCLVVWLFVCFFGDVRTGGGWMVEGLRWRCLFFVFAFVFFCMDIF